MIARLDGTAALVTGASAPRQLGRAGERGTGFPHLAATPRDRYLRLDDDQDHRIWSAQPGGRAPADRPVPERSRRARARVLSRRSVRPEPGRSGARPIKLGDCSVAIREQDHPTDEIAVERV